MLMHSHVPEHCSGHAQCGISDVWQRRAIAGWKAEELSKTKWSLGHIKCPVAPVKYPEI